MMKSIINSFIPQHDQSDCGVACLLSIIKYYKGQNTLENLRRISGTNITGTTLLGLQQAAIQCGFDADGCEANLDALIVHGEPCILHVTIDKHLQHYVVCYGTKQLGDKTQFIIGDPAKGIVYLDEKELDKIWISKTCLTLSPNVEFQTAVEVGRQKIQWIKELLKEDIPLLSSAVLLGVFTAVLGLCMAFFSQRLIDDILPAKNILKLNLGIAALFVLLLAKELLSALRQFFLMRQSKEFNLRITQYFYNHLLALPRPFFDSRKIGELTARLNDTSRIQRVISQIASNVVIDAIVALVSMVFLFVYSWKIGLACLFFIPILFFIIYKRHKEIVEGQRAIMGNYASAEANYISTLQGIEPIKNNNKQQLFTQINTSIYQRYQDSVFALGKTGLGISIKANIVNVFFILGVLLFASYQVLADHIKTGELMAIVGICSSLLPSIANLAMVAIPINEAKIAFDRMFEFTEMKAEQLTDDDDIFNFESLAMQNLTFRFVGRKRLLNDISFSVKKGEIVAIMGENGSGKSTLLSIIQKNYAPEAGSININGHMPLSDLSIGQWRKMIGIVPQQIHIFNGNVLENIAFDDVQRNPEKVEMFLKEYGFDIFINGLPQGYMTLVGEEGINLSGGQRQMVAIARALYHSPQLLILDEATAAMDRQSELFVLELLESLKDKLAIIFVTHRLHVLKNLCDRAYIVENGITYAEGNHEVLLKTDNLYSRYWADLVA